MEQDFYGKMCPPLQNKYHLWPDVCIMVCVAFSADLTLSVASEDTLCGCRNGQKTPVLPRGVKKAERL